MFAPDQEKTAAELLRVVKPGGRIGMANWTPDGRRRHDVQNDLQARAAAARASSRRCSGAPRSTCASSSATAISDLGSRRRISRQPFRSADHYIEFFRTYFGPTQMAYERVGAEGEQALTDDLKSFLEECNTAGDRAHGARGRVPAGDRDARLAGPRLGARR